jgi:hypothetical protein
MTLIERQMKHHGFALTGIGGNLTGWTKRIGSVTIQVTHCYAEAADADPADDDWIIGAHDDGGSYLYHEPGYPLARAVELAARLPTDPKAFAAYAAAHPEAQHEAA